MDGQCGLYSASRRPVGVSSKIRHIIDSESNASYCIYFWRIEYYVCQIESILNSCPLSYQVSADNSLKILTHGHFLIGENLLSLPIDQDSPQQNLSKRFKLLWAVWLFLERMVTSYLNCVRRRNKWSRAKENLKINDIVIVKFDDLTFGR